MPLHDDMSGFSVTPPVDPFAPANATEVRADRMVEAYFKGDKQTAQTLLDQSNRAAGIPVPDPVADALAAIAPSTDFGGRDGSSAPELPPVGQPEPVADAAVQSARAELEAIAGGEEAAEVFAHYNVKFAGNPLSGPDLIREWGTGQDFDTNLAHGQAGLARLGRELPVMNAILYALPATLRSMVTPELLRWAAQDNRRYSGFTGGGR